MIDYRKELIEKLPAQFVGKVNIETLIKVFGLAANDMQEIFERLVVMRWLINAEGAQLDGCGEIVGQSRLIPEAVAIPFFGFQGQPAAKGFNQARFRRKGETWKSTSILADTEYRKLIYAKIIKNTSNCSIPDLITLYSKIFEVDTVIIREIGNAKLHISIGKNLLAGDMLFATAVGLFVKAGGVGIEHKSYFNKKAFGFKGQPYSTGFNQAPFAKGF